VALLVWVATNPEGPVADDGISRTAVNADDPAEMFSFVPTTELSRLASDLESVRAAPGEVLMRQGEPAHSVETVIPAATPYQPAQRGAQTTTSAGRTSPPTSPNADDRRA
jgi:hypothetical protein